MSVKRYNLDVDSDGDWEIGDAYPITVEEPDGDYVKAEDYDALAAECAALREQLAAAESKEVCTVAHSDEVLAFCPYCKIESLRSRLAEVEAQRDEAFTMSKCECGPEECCANLVKHRARLADLQAERELIVARAENAEAAMEGAESRLNLADAEVAMLRHFNAEAEADALLQLARDYVEANQGGWCRDGVGSSIVLKHIDAHLSRKADSAEGGPR